MAAGGTSPGKSCSFWPCLVEKGRLDAWCPRGSADASPACGLPDCLSLVDSLSLSDSTMEDMFSDAYQLLLISA